MKMFFIYFSESFQTLNLNDYLSETLNISSDSLLVTFCDIKTSCQLFFLKRMNFENRVL